MTAKKMQLLQIHKSQASCQLLITEEINQTGCLTKAYRGTFFTSFARRELHIENMSLLGTYFPVCC